MHCLKMDHTGQQSFHQMTNVVFNTQDNRQSADQRDSGNIHMMNTFNQSSESIPGFTTQPSHMISFGSPLNQTSSVWSNETSRSLGILGGTSVRRVAEIESNKQLEKVLHHADLNLLQSNDLPLGNVHANIETKGQIDDDWPTKTGTKDYTEKNLPRELMSKMFGLLKEGMFCDAVLQTGNKEIKIPENIPIEVTSQLVHYLYDGNVSLTVDNVGQFARVASLFKLEHLLHICEDFVKCFSLEDSLLDVSEEDIVVLQPQTLDSKSPPVTTPVKTPTASVKETTKISPKQKNKGKRKSEEKGSAKKGGTSKVRIEVSPPKVIKVKEKTPPKVLHLYGTRAASAAAATKGDNISGSKSKASVENESDKLTSNISLTKNEKEVGGVNTTERNIDLNPRKRRLTQALLQKEAENKVEIEQEIDDGHEEDEYEAESSVTPEKTTQSDVQKSLKRKPVKTLKKMKSVLYQSYKKGRQKKFQAVPPPAKPEITMRPPPKKRAKEFTNSEEMSAVQHDPASESATSDSSPIKPLVKKKKKKYSVKPIVVENIQHLVAELERRSASIPENERQFKCDLCKDTPFVCEICGQGFKSRTCLNSHVFHRHSSVRKHECGECQKTFKTKTQLLVHLRTHTGEKPFHCPECTYKSTTRGNMRLHLTNRHKLDSQDIKNMMYQIQTMSKAFTTPDAETNENILTSENQEVAIIENVRLPVITVEGPRQQETVEVNHLNATLENIISTSQQSNQVVYREPTLAERQILFQSLGGHQPGAENPLTQGQGQNQVVCQEQEVAQPEQETQIIMPEHLQNHQIIVQHDQANGDGTLVWDTARAAFVKVNNGSIALIQDARELQPQEPQTVQILNARSIIQEQHPEVTRTLQEPDHILANEGNRLHSVQGQGQQFTTDRQILDQAQSLIQGRHFEFQQQDTNIINNQKQDSHLHTVQQNQLHINRNQLIEIPLEVIGRHTAVSVQSQLANNRHTEIQTQQDPTVLGDAGSLHSQEQTQSIVFKDDQSLLEGGAQNTTKSAVGQSQVPLPRKQQLATLSLGGQITLNYHTNVPITSSKTQTSQTYLVDTQNIITSIASGARQISQQSPAPSQSSSHSLDTTVAQQTYDPATTLSSQNYTDANNMIYQYYQQYQQGS
ncbi:hypothetical protein KUTeg_022928 [Tegillarca granosa]|uniref:C2H2-type domain-containing protein n=1 Tax=Tegillarca granosa TaxID=220873 RepID=A0ABQ9E067_TEGGR|nr:hypothetical protein KUTeg_022928 [Tegillarca granosa]